MVEVLKLQILTEGRTLGRPAFICSLMAGNVFPKSLIYIVKSVYSEFAPCYQTPWSSGIVIKAANLVTIS